MRLRVRRPRTAGWGATGWSEPPFWTLPHATLSDVGDGRTFERGSATDYDAMVERVLMASAPIAAVVFVRQAVFAEGRFAFVRYDGGVRQEPFTTDALAVLERPWPGATTRTLLARMELDASLAGNSYWVRTSSGLRRLRPDRVRVLIGRRVDSTDDPEAEIVGYQYVLGGRSRTFAPEEVAHYAPLPDPRAHWRGMSWLTPVLQEVAADVAATQHKLGFFRRGASPSMVVTYDAQVSSEELQAAIASFEERFAGAGNSYRVLHVGGGADIKPLSFDFSQLDFARLVGRAETRIAAAAGVHPVIVGFSEGLQGSSLNAGNYQQVRRRFVDGTMRPLWSAAAEALERVVDVPQGARLWVDDRDIAFLRQDAAEQARIRQAQAQTIVTLIRDGFTPSSAVEAVVTGDLRRLQHTGLVSVQLQPPLTEET